METPDLTQEFLFDQYVNQHKSINDIVLATGYSQRVIRNRLLVFGIPVRSQSRKGRTNKRPANRYDLSGREFGSLTVGHYIRCQGWFCTCKCGNTTIISTQHLTQHKRQSCGCYQSRKGSKSPTWKGCGEVPGSLVARYRSQARLRKISFEVDVEYLWKLFQSQQGLCKYTGAKLQFRPECTASLDRIDSTQGYTKQNVQWVHKRINKMKNDSPSDEFVFWCQQVAQHQVAVQNSLPILKSSSLILHQPF